MIKVYVFITGLALYQFSSTGGPTTVIFPSGGYDYPGFTHIPAHSLTVLAGDYVPVNNLPSSLESTLTVACPSGGCSAIKVPDNIPQLADLLDGKMPVVKSKCATLGTGADCHPWDLTVKGRNGILQLSGNWSAEALTDCQGSYPYKLGPFVDLNYVRAAQSQELMFNDTTRKPTVNTVLFTTTIGSMDELTVSDTALKAALDRKTSLCNALPHFKESGASGCSVVLIRSGEDHDAYVSGEADVHFAALYSLLENQLGPAGRWLPTAQEWRVCKKIGGGGAGMSHCTGASVVVP